MASPGGTDEMQGLCIIEQMVDKLKVLMMTKPVLDPIPIEYHSCVLHLLEAYASLRQDKKDMEAKHRKTVETIQRGFQSVIDEYFEREAGFLAEIKRLEVIMSQTSFEGLETVTMARTASLVDRSKEGSQQFRTRIQDTIHGRTGCS
jgi:hypothetical protein